MSAISGISASSSSRASMQIWQAMIQQRRQDFSQNFSKLASALQSGNLSDAQNAFSTLQSLNIQWQSIVASAVNAAGNNDSGSDNTTANMVASLGQALQSGDISSAQSALAQLQLITQVQPSDGQREYSQDCGASIENRGANNQDSNSSDSLPDNSTISIYV
jgi:hypothetical protein